MRIAQVLYAQSWGEVTPQTIEKGLGGRETAMVKLAETWADGGNEVTNFVNIENGSRFAGRQPDVLTCEGGGYHDGFHEYLPISMASSMLGNIPWDAVIAWEIPSIFNDEKIRDNARVKVCEMQVCHLPDKEMLAAQQHCDYVAALSKWHAEFLIHSGMEMENGDVIVLPNGVDMNRYPQSIYKAKVKSWKHHNAPKFVYSSSPDRGLLHILKSWKEIRRSFPLAELSICYGLNDYIGKMKWAHVRQAQMSVEIEELIKQPGIKNLEKIGQTELAKLQMEADAWLYPLDALWPTESGCITAVENAAAGNPLIISDGDCLKSEFGKFSEVIDLPFQSNDLVQAVESVLSNKNIYQTKQAQGRAFAETRTWEGIGNQWLDLFANVRS